MTAGLECYLGTSRSKHLGGFFFCGRSLYVFVSNWQDRLKLATQAKRATTSRSQHNSAFDKAVELQRR